MICWYTYSRKILPAQYWINCVCKLRSSVKKIAYLLCCTCDYLYLLLFVCAVPDEVSHSFIQQVSHLCCTICWQPLNLICKYSNNSIFPQIISFHNSERLLFNLLENRMVMAWKKAAWRVHCYHNEQKPHCIVWLGREKRRVLRKWWNQCPRAQQLE